MSAYAMGWEVSLNGNHEIFHGGVNPNFTSYISFRSDGGIAVAVLSNSNSNLTKVIGENVMKLLAGGEVKDEFDRSDKLDKAFSVISFILTAYLVALAIFAMVMFIHIYRGKRRFEAISRKRIMALVLSVLALVPFIYGLYLLPAAAAGFGWNAIAVWMPVSFGVAVTLFLISIVASYFLYVLSAFFPEGDPFKRILPRLVLISMLSGLANMVIVVLITSSIDSTV